MPTVLEISFWTRARATFGVWWPILLAADLPVVAIYIVWKRRGGPEPTDRVNAVTPGQPSGATNR